MSYLVRSHLGFLFTLITPGEVSISADRRWHVARSAACFAAVAIISQPVNMINRERLKMKQVPTLAKTNCARYKYRAACLLTFTLFIFRIVLRGSA